jgi:uncharacterized membrane protein YagU involved in acid resistance
MTVFALNIFGSGAAGGFLGTLVLTTILRTAGQMGLTRMDLPFLLGTMVTENRRKAKGIGYVLHFILGLAFAMMYVEFFQLVGRSSWWVGALLGLLQALFTGTVLVNELLPVVHPRMATTDTAVNEYALIEPPGFLMLNYGRNTFLVTLVAHIAYGWIIGALVTVR